MTGLRYNAWLMSPLPAYWFASPITRMKAPCRLYTSAYSLHAKPRARSVEARTAGRASVCRNTCIYASCAMLLQHESRYHEGTRTRLCCHHMPVKPYPMLRLDCLITALGILARSVAWQSAMSFCTVGSASLAAIPTVGCGPYTYIRAVVTRNGPALPVLASPHVRGAARVCT